VSLATWLEYRLKDSINGVGGVSPVGPVWPTPHTGHPGFPPGTLANRSLPQWPDQARPEAAPPPAADPESDAAFVLPDAATPALPMTTKDLCHLLREAGVTGIGPVGGGFELGGQELSSEVRYAYRHIANSLLDVLAVQHDLPLSIQTALAADPRDEREMGLLIESNPKLVTFLGMTVNAGVINRWHKLGQSLLEQVAQFPQNVVGNLRLIEPPTRHWHP
jgi:hypothetical protein